MEREGGYVNNNLWLARNEILQGFGLLVKAELNEQPNHGEVNTAERLAAEAIALVEGK